MPVLEEGTLLGKISIGDVLKAQRDFHFYCGQIATLETQILATE